MSGRKKNRYSASINAILIASAAALVLYLARYVATGSVQFSFMAWNLVLSLAAVGAGALFVQNWKSTWRPVSIVLFLVWLFLLPNTFYMLTDYIHVQESGDINVLFDIVLIGFFAMNGFMHGILSLLIVHKALLKKYAAVQTHLAIGVIIVASSFAVDMGRYLRWNSWDIIVNPAAVLFDISNTLLNPTNYDRSFLITGVFFVTITSLYAVVWQLSKLQWRPNGTDTK
jgi:uncharacterized membrane protein